MELITVEESDVQSIALFLRRREVFQLELVHPFRQVGTMPVEGLFDARRMFLTDTVLKLLK